jgi:hypothetical protein
MKKTNLERIASNHRGAILEDLYHVAEATQEEKRAIQNLIDKKVIPFNMQLRVLVQTRYKHLRNKCNYNRTRAIAEIEAMYDLSESTIKCWLKRFVF